MNALVLEFLATLARWLLTSVGGYLIAHHVLTADQSDRFSSAIVEHLAIWLPGLGALAWSLWAKYRSRVKFLTALQVPAGTSEKSVDARISNGMGAEVSRTIVLLACVLIGVGSFSACASTNGALQTATIAETGIVQLVHAAVVSEAAAYTASPPAISPAQHQRNIAVFLQVNAGEAALNAALLTWAANIGQPAPAAVTNAIKALTPILADLAPILGASGPAATFAADLSAILAALQAPAASSNVQK